MTPKPHKDETEDSFLKDGTMLHTSMPTPDNIPALPQPQQGLSYDFGPEGVKLVTDNNLLLELRVFTAAHDQKIPLHTRDLIRDLWDRYMVIEEALVKLLEENGR